MTRIVNPGTGELVAEVDDATPELLDTAVRRAPEAFGGWARLSYTDRGAPPHEGAGAFAWLLDRVELFVRRYVVLDDSQAAAAALWVAHSHAVDAARATPYMHISSAEPESGKTRLLEVASSSSGSRCRP